MMALELRPQKSSSAFVVTPTMEFPLTQTPQKCPATSGGDGADWGWIKRFLEEEDGGLDVSGTPPPPLVRLPPSTQGTGEEPIDDYYDDIQFEGDTPSPGSDVSYQHEEHEAVNGGLVESGLLIGSPLSNIPVSHPTSNDVLCGRGGRTNQHVGNMNWRMLVAANKEYYATLTKNQPKSALSLSIVLTVRGLVPPGRFLEQDSKSELWFDVGDEKAQKKTSQALRELGGKGQSSPTQKTGLLSVLRTKVEFPRYFPFGRPQMSTAGTVQLHQDAERPTHTTSMHAPDVPPQEVRVSGRRVDRGLEWMGLSNVTMMSIASSVAPLSLAPEDRPRPQLGELAGVSIGTMMMSIGTSLGTMSLEDQTRPQLEAAGFSMETLSIAPEDQPLLLEALQSEPTPLPLLFPGGAPSTLNIPVVTTFKAPGKAGGDVSSEIQPPPALNDTYFCGMPPSPPAMNQKTTEEDWQDLESTHVKSLEEDFAHS